MRTFIGELVFRFKDDASGKAKTTAAQLAGAMKGIEREAQRLNSMPWDGRFTHQLEKLGADAKYLKKLQTSWVQLHDTIKTRNLGSAAAKSEIANFKQAAVSQLAAARALSDSHMDAVEKRARKFRNNIQTIMKPALVALGGYTGVYMVGVAGREGLTASSEWEREKFRGRMANIPQGEQNQLLDGSEKLGSQYPSVSITDIAEMARNARAMMGDTNRALQILPELVRGLVTLQSAKGTDAAVSELRNLLRGIDNAGKNQDGDIGIQSTKDIIAGMIRASQIEGEDLDVGKMFQFARRGKIAVPGLSTKFLATVQPALSQDMTPEGFGTALSSAYQAFVIGSNSVASKQNLQAQRDLGIRKGEGKGSLVGDEIFGTNPYQWVQEVLVPALEKKGVNTNNDVETAKAVAQLVRNTNASSLLTRMIQQQQQIDRLVSQYGEAMGPEAAEQARFKDPFVAYKGFVESLRNLSAAVGEDVMPGIVSGLNSLAGGINSLQQAWRDGDPLAKAGVTAGAVATGYGTWKIGQAVWGLITAGTNLNAASAHLEAAALAMQGGTGVGGAVKGAAGAGSAAGLGWMARIGAGVMAGFGMVPEMLGHTPGSTMEEKVKNQDQQRRAMRRLLGMDEDHEWTWREFLFGKAADPNFSFRESMSLDTGKYKGGVTSAKKAGEEMEGALSVQAKPAVDTSDIQRAIDLANQLKNTLAGVGSAASSSRSSLQSEMDRNYADFGVVP